MNVIIDWIREIITDVSKGLVYIILATPFIMLIDGSLLEIWLANKVESYSRKTPILKYRINSENDSLLLFDDGMYEMVKNDDYQFGEYTCLDKECKWIELREKFIIIYSLRTTEYLVKNNYVRKINTSYKFN